MALEPNTLADVLAQIRNRFQRYAAQFETYVTLNIESWLDNLCRMYPWWFLTTNPGSILRTSFPYASMASIPLKVGNWVDIGWLKTTAGTNVYDIYTVRSEQAYYATPADATLWHLALCQEVRYVYEFDYSGNFLQDLDIQDDVSALTYMGYQTRSRPMQAMWRTLENRSQLVFDPVPDQAYLYAISFTQSTPPMWTADSGVTYNHKFITVLPEALVQYGIIQAAQHFDEPNLAREAERILFGDPPNLHLPRRQKKFLGLLDTLRNDTSKRQTQYEQEKVMLLNSKVAASGRGGTGDAMSTHQKFFSPRYRRSIY